MPEAQHLFGEIHQIDVIGVGHVELEHGELGVMANEILRYGSYG